MREFVKGQVWVFERPLRFLGIPMGARMTAVQLDDGAFWVHSPVAPDQEVSAFFARRGPVRYIVAPNILHHLFVNPFAGAFPDASIYVSPRLPAKRPDIAAAAVLTDQAPSGWAGQIDQVLLGGHLFLDEAVFFHRRSRTLIVTDLCMSGHHDSPWLMRLAARMAGFYERPAPPIEVRLTFTDRSALRDTLDRILGWDFERIVLAHGKLIETDARGVIERAFAFARR